MRIRTIVSLFACVAPLFLVGCASAPTAFGPSGVGYGGVFTNVTYPAANTSDTQYKLGTSDFAIVGPVRGEGSSHSILGLLAFGNSGYNAALEDARLRGADDIANVRVDMRYFNLLGIYASVDTIVTGTGISWRPECMKK